MDIYFYRPSLLLYPWILYKKSMEFQEFLCYGTPPYSVHALEGRNVEGGGAGVIIFYIKENILGT